MCQTKKTNKLKPARPPFAQMFPTWAARAQILRTQRRRIRFTSRGEVTSPQGSARDPEFILTNRL
jgi:hypothetical protein